MASSGSLTREFAHLSHKIINLKPPRVLNKVAADVWEKDVWEIQAKSGSSGSCPLFLHFQGKTPVQKMSGRIPGSPRHPASRHPRSSDLRKCRTHTQRHTARVDSPQASSSQSRDYLLVCWKAHLREPFQQT